MKREIKFRVWDYPNKQFIPTDKYEICFSEKNRLAFARMISNWENYREGEYAYEPNQRLNQYTGLKDINGKEIYEGDILKYLHYPQPAHVFWVTPETGYDFCGWHCKYFYPTSDCEIIGNIYENPELLDESN